MSISALPSRILPPPSMFPTSILASMMRLDAMSFQHLLRDKRRRRRTRVEVWVGMLRMLCFMEEKWGYFTTGERVSPWFSFPSCSPDQQACMPHVRRWLQRQPLQRIHHPSGCGRCLESWKCGRNSWASTKGAKGEGGVKEDG